MKSFDDFLAGYRRFRGGDWAEERARWSSLAEGQSPGVMVVGCSDSRIDPATIFDAAPGEMFVVRNVANLVPPYEEGGGLHGVSAALEFAVTQLEVREIVVLGHGGCGGVAASLSGRFRGRRAGEGGFIADWVSILDATRDRVAAAHGEGADALAMLEHEAVKTSLANLRTFPFVAPREASGALRLIGAWFAITDGHLHLLDEATGRFSLAE